MRDRHIHFQLSLALSLLLICSAIGFGIDAVAPGGQNPKWHCSDTTGVATFLAGDKAETAKLVLVKAKSFDQTLTVDSDASYIVLYSGDSPHVVFKIPPNPDGTSSKLKLTGGDQPTLFFNDKEQVQQQGKWIQIATMTDKMMTLELGTASFAKVKFENSALAVVPKPEKAVPTAVHATPEKSTNLLHEVTANQLQAVTNAFDQGIHKKCTSCNGTGEISVQVKTGSRNAGPYEVPTYSTEKQKCERCHGKGIDRSNDDALIRLAGNMVKGMASLKKDDPRSQQVLTKAYDEISKDMIGDQKTWTLLTANGKSILAQKSPTLGTSVVSLVQVEKSIKMPNEQRRYLVRVIGTDRRVYVDDPTLADELKSGHALMGGMVDRPVLENGGETSVTTLHGGFLIAPQVDHDFWWWYKDKE